MAEPRRKLKAGHELAHSRDAGGRLDQDELRLPGGRLLAMLVARAAAQGHNFQVMSAALGVTYGYVTQLRSGVRDVSNVSDEFLRAAAAYLGIPRLAAMVAAGKLTLADMEESPDPGPAISAAWEAMIVDAEGAAPGELDTLSNEGRLFVLRLYERATGRKLLPPQVARKALAAYWTET